MCASISLQSLGGQILLLPALSHWGPVRAFSSKSEVGIHVENPKQIFECIYPKGSVLIRLSTAMTPLLSVCF